MALLAVLAVSASTTSCRKTQPASAESAATRYGAEVQETMDGAVASTEQAAAQVDGQIQEGRNRFGFAGADESEGPIKPLHRDNTMYDPHQQVASNNTPESVRKITEPSVPKIEAPSLLNVPQAPTPPPAPHAPVVDDGVVKLGFANNIAGDKLHVTLPGEYASLGRVSIERIDPAGNPLGSPWSRGTQMQIPNPRVAGGKIYFKVP